MAMVEICVSVLAKGSPVILKPGTFNVNEYRKAIPVWVKLQALINSIIQRGELPLNDGKPLDARDLQFDHCPALVDRPYDTVAGDFIPQQNDPEFIVPLRKRTHLQKTTGRKEDAERTVTTRGSDVGEAARTRHIQDSETIHQAKMLHRVDPDAARRLLGSVRQKTRLRPKRKIASRGFGNQHRPMQSRKRNRGRS